MSFVLPTKASLIEEGLSSEDAKVWDDAEKLNRKETLQNVLNQLHTSSVPLDSAICVSLDEDSDASFSDFTNSINDNFTEVSRNITTHPHYEFVNPKETSIESLNIISRDASDSFTKDLNAIKPDDNPLTKAHIHSLELQLMHLQTQNQSLQNTIIQNNLNLEKISVAKSETLEQLNLLKAYFQHLLPPASSNSDPSLSTTSCVLPSLSELRGDVLQETKLILDKSKEKLRLATVEVTRIKHESDLQIQQIASKNISLRNQVQCLQNKIRQQSLINKQSEKQIQKQNKNHIQVEKHLEQQIHVLKEKLQTLSNDNDDIGIKTEEYIQSVSDLRHENEELKKQKTSLKNQSKQDQSEIISLLGERNALRGQLNEFKAHSSSKNSRESSFHQELLRMQTSYSQLNQQLQEKITSLECMCDEKAKLWKEAKQNEAASEMKLQEINKGCQILIQTLLNLEREKVLFVAETKMNVKKIVNYALMGISQKHRREFLGQNVDQEIQQGLKNFKEYMSNEFKETSIQTSTLGINMISCGTNTEEKISNYNDEQMQFKQKAETITKQNKNLHDSNRLLHNQLYSSLTQSHRNTTDATATEIELNRVKEENITLIKSKKFMQDENRKLVEKRIQIEDLFATSRSEYTRLQEKVNKNEKHFKRENGAQRKKIEKLEKEIEQISSQKDHWENTAKNLETQLQFGNQAHKLSNNVNDDIVATVSFDKSITTNSEYNNDSNIINYASRYWDASSTTVRSDHKASDKMINDESMTTNSLDDQIETLNGAPSEKQVQIDLSSTSKLLNNQSFPFTIDNTEIPLEEWLQTWESTMDFHVSEAANSMSEALSSALIRLVDEVIPMEKEEDVSDLLGKEKTSNESVENYVEMVATQMAEELQKGLEMIQNYNSMESSRKQDKLEVNQRDGTKLIAKLESSLQNIDEQHSMIKKQHLLLNAAKNETGPNIDSTNPTPDDCIQTEDRKQDPTFETQKFEKNGLDFVAPMKEVSDRHLKVTNKLMQEDVQEDVQEDIQNGVKDLFSDQKKFAACAMSDKTTQASNDEFCFSNVSNEAENLKEKLKCFLKVIENEQSYAESRVENVKKSNIGTETKIMPEMLSQGVGTTSSISKPGIPREAFSQTYFDTIENIDNTKEQLSKVQATCSELQKEKAKLENDLVSAKKEFDSKVQTMRQEKEDDLKFLKLYLDSSLPTKTSQTWKNQEGPSNPKSRITDSPIQDRIYRIRQSAERAALISKHEEEQSALINECNAALMSKMESFNHHFNFAVEKNLVEVKEDRDKFIRFAVGELKKEYNNRIVNLLQSHQQDIEKLKLESKPSDIFGEEDIIALEEKHGKDNNKKSSNKSSNPDLDISFRNQTSFTPIDLMKISVKSLNSAEKDHRNTFTENSRKEATSQPRSNNLDKNKSPADESPTVFNRCVATDSSCKTSINDSVEDESFNEIEDFVMSVLEDCDKSKQRVLN